MDRRGITVISILAVLVIAIGAILLVRKHESEVAAMAALKAKYQQLNSVNEEASSAFDRFTNASNQYDTTQTDAQQAGQRRHDLLNREPVDYAAALTDIEQEKSDVERLQGLSQDKADAARDAATAFGSYLGDAMSSSLLNEVTSASEAEGKYLADWLRAANQISDTLSDQVNGHWYLGNTEDVESLYRSSDEEGAVSRSRWSTVNARLSELHDRLRSDIASLLGEIGSAPPLPITANTSSATPPPAQTDDSAPQNPAPSTPKSSSDDADQCPLAARNVLPLLRGTSALSVSTQPDGSTAYVVVPGTPAKGKADSNQFWVGKMADGRWVGVVPLDSGGSVGIAYALMWVWSDGQAQFVGEIPADNGGLGHLSIAVVNGEINMKWPVNGGLIRTQVLTLDGIHLRTLSDSMGPSS